MIRANSFPQAMEFRAKPQNLSVSVEFPYLHRILQKCLFVITTTPHHNHFTTLFPGPPEWAGARIELLDFMVQGKTNRGRQTDHPTGRHSTGPTSAHLHHPP